MTAVLPAVSFEEIAAEQEKVLALIKEHPVVVQKAADPVAVLIAMAEWDKILEQLEALQDFVDVLEAKLELATGADKIVEADIAQLQEMAGHVVPA